MIVYRIVKKKSRSNDLSGQGAANEGGRWNSQGVHAVYTSESRALALLEILVHVDLEDLPDNMIVIVIEINESAPVLEINITDLPHNWREPDNLELRQMGDKIISERNFVAFKVKSAVVPSEHNVIINPNFPDFASLVRILRVEDLPTDKRLG
ncbi:RES family NAD+ phosphorylase [Dyadobacter luticola]|uniref:RES domain-containing protein n=1 Tax=Dyadobacter luticola TaxID=1979387 RepID=A0A5R9L578_9BACT|nr:RES family NAD+ phosphorylase [Dyadobacter luticola]TLV03724.1 RES domain-containing protein [Dyadobacter luticola]